VPLGKEFEAMMNYLRIEKARFRDKLEVDCQIEDVARGVAVPGIILQPLVENAIKHGRQTSHTPLKIRVHVFCPDSESVRIEVSNAGSWLESRNAEKPCGVGLENLRRRLDLLYPCRHKLEITNEDGWVKVLVCLPTGMENGEGTARADS
jgi:two-component system LytT family sensor kinase